jgi:hypothetical protein
VPSLVAIALKAAVSAAKGNGGAAVHLGADPYSDTGSLKAGVNYFPDLPDGFYTNNTFPLATSASEPSRSSQDQAEPVVAKTGDGRRERAGVSTRSCPGRLDDAG